MKKNLLLGLMALAGLFTSCSKDDVSSLPTDQSNMVSMKVEMPADFAKTRAVPTEPGNHQLRCILEVWDKDGTNLKVRQEQIYMSGTEMTFTFGLSDQADYKAVLWADYIASDAASSSVTIPNTYTHYADKYYKTDDATGLKKVTIIESAYTYTDRLREAFTGTTLFTKAADKLEVPKVTLKRPLTKVTLAEKNTTNFALCKKVKATYTVPSEFNAFAETVGAATYAAIYDASPSGLELPVSGNTYKTLFTDYVFTASESTMGEIALTFIDQHDGSTLNSKTIPAGVSLKRNYWVRAAGNLITSNYNPSTSVTVDMTTDWTNQDEDTPIVYSIGDLYPDAINPVGVVYSISDGGAHGKVISLNVGNNLAWSLESKLLSATSPDGAVNMATIQNESNWETNYPVFKWCVDYTMFNGKHWYLPSKEELMAIVSNDNLAIVNTSIVSAGGKKLESTYVSSTEKDKDNMYYVVLDTSNNTSPYFTETPKNGAYEVLQFHAFLAF